jgi:hypothetical protein
MTEIDDRDEEGNGSSDLVTFLVISISLIILVISVVLLLMGFGGSPNMDISKLGPLGILIVVLFVWLMMDDDDEKSGSQP